MVIKKRLIRRKPVEPEPEEEEIEDLEPEDEEFEAEIEEEEEEEVKPSKVAPRGITHKVISKVPPKPAPKPAPKPVVEEPEEEEEEEEPAKKIKVQKVEDTVVSSIVLQAMQHMKEGKSLLITSLGNDKYSIVFSDHALPAPSSKMRGKEYWEAVTSPDYLAWSEEWQNKSYEEKVKFAQKKKISWDSHPNPRVDVIRLTEAVRKALGIEKYKPEYRTRSARASLRE